MTDLELFKPSDFRAAEYRLTEAWYASCAEIDTHSARLIDIRELKPKDTAEQILRDYLNTIERWKYDIHNDRFSADAQDVCDLKSRIRKLLDGGSGR